LSSQERPAEEATTLGEEEAAEPMQVDGRSKEQEEAIQDTTIW
jgi:hypothetical protein